MKGFKAGGLRRKYGLAIILSEKKTSSALMLTSNKVKASPLIVSKENIEKGEIFGIVANSGNANCFTGKRGLKNAFRMCELAAKKFKLRPENFLVASTGIIGKQLDMKEIETLINEIKLGSSEEYWRNSAKAIMTTDTIEKIVTRKIGKAEMIGIAKGSGMIAPCLQCHATMLCFLATNAFIPQDKINEMLEEAVENSFNMVNIDNDTSTNDMVVLLANGKVREDYNKIQKALNEACIELAKAIARDGEGATKYVEVKISGALTKEDARKAARAIAGSNLVKTAIFGENPNFGRVIAALGYSGAEIKPERITLIFNDVCIVEKGKIREENLKKARETLKEREIFIQLNLDLGEETAVAFGCDMSYDYVKINAEYN